MQAHSRDASHPGKNNKDTAGGSDEKPVPDATGIHRLIRSPAAVQEAFNRSEEHTSELQSRFDLVCRLLLEKKKYKIIIQEYEFFQSICYFPFSVPSLFLC